MSETGEVGYFTRVSERWLRCTSFHFATLNWKVANFLSSTVKPRATLGAYNYITFITVKPTVIRYRKELYMKDVLEVITLVFAIVGLIRISDAISEIFDHKIKK